MSDYTTADEINREELEPVSCLSGRKYGIRRVTPAELAKNGILAIPGIDALDEIRKRALQGIEPTAEEQETLRLVENVILCLGVASVRVVDKPLPECPAGCVSVDALRADREELVFAINRKSHFGRIEETVVNEDPREGESFRGEESALDVPAEAAGEPAAH